MNEQQLTAKDVATRLNTSERNVLYWAQTGVLKGTKLGRAWRFSEEAVQEFLRRGSTQAG